MIIIVMAMHISIMAIIVVVVTAVVAVMMIMMMAIVAAAVVAAAMIAAVAAMHFRGYAMMCTIIIAILIVGETHFVWLGYRSDLQEFI